MNFSSSYFFYYFNGIICTEVINKNIRNGKETALNAVSLGAFDKNPFIISTERNNPVIRDVYKNEEEWKGLKVDPANIQRDVLVKLPRLDLFAKTK